jgi:hypothetical protein
MKFLCSILFFNSSYLHGIVANELFHSSSCKVGILRTQFLLMKENKARIPQFLVGAYYCRKLVVIVVGIIQLQNLCMDKTL